MFDLTRQPSKEKIPHLESVYLPATSFMVIWHFKSWSCRDQKWSFWMFGSSSRRRSEIPRDSQRTAEAAGLP
jgi:hypothetical protein